MKSYAYFIQAVSGGAIKIGRTNDLDRRLRELQTSHHEKLKVLKYITFDSEDEVRRFESLMHERYTSHRLQGEWFDITEWDIERDLAWADSVSSLIGDAKRLQSEVDDLRQAIALYPSPAGKDYIDLHFAASSFTEERMAKVDKWVELTGSEHPSKMIGRLARERSNR